MTKTLIFNPIILFLPVLVCDVCWVMHRTALFKSGPQNLNPLICLPLNSYQCSTIYQSIAEGKSKKPCTCWKNNQAHVGKKDVSQMVMIVDLWSASSTRVQGRQDRFQRAKASSGGSWVSRAQASPKANLAFLVIFQLADISAKKKLKQIRKNSLFLK